MIEWQLGNGTDEMLRAMLQPTFNKANEMMSQVLQIPAQILSDAVFAALELEPEAGETESLPRVVNHGHSSERCLSKESRIFPKKHVVY